MVRLAWQESVSTEPGAVQICFILLRSENHHLKVDRFQGVRSAELIVCGKPLLSIIALHPGHTSCVLLREARVRGTACRVPTERIGRAC